MTDSAPLSLSFPAIRSKKVTAAFDGGAIRFDAGVLLLARAERRLGIIDRLAALIPDPRDPTRVLHGLGDILRTRVLAIAAGYEDADDLDALRHDPAFMMALGKAPCEAVGLASQPTMSRWENAPDVRTLIRLGREMVDIYCASHDGPPNAVTLDIDDTFDAAQGQQHLTFWNGFHRERGYASIHVYETRTGRPVAFVLRPACTPSGKEITGHVRRLILRILRHWPDTRILLRGDGHYARPEAMGWCEAHGVEYIFGLPGNSVLRDNPEIAVNADASLSCGLKRLSQRIAPGARHAMRRKAGRSPAASSPGSRRPRSARISARSSPR
jgi:Transposase DDE domain group 1